MNKVEHYLTTENFLADFSAHSQKLNSDRIHAHVDQDNQVTFFHCCFIPNDLAVVSLRDCDQLKYLSTLDPRGLF